MISLVRIFSTVAFSSNYSSSIKRSSIWRKLIPQALTTRRALPVYRCVFVGYRFCHQQSNPSRGFVTVDIGPVESSTEIENVCVQRSGRYQKLLARSLTL